MTHDDDIHFLKRCIALATEALEAGDEPFGSVLVDRNGRLLKEARNRVGGGDATQHPEFELARWAAQHLGEDERYQATVFTSGEHCPMCAAAHAWVKLGRIVYASSTRQLTTWLEELGVEAPPLKPLAITEVAPGIPVDGPYPALAQEIHALHRRYHGKN
ncbi:nucleoside deaminase [Larsenimonas suaedae]|uniref:Nucleoside deaminase n=1 Tax=Larsenimonas suaedae TaxID=1851019 RepID=A0ABU1GW02_9GAMM|nr:nucleoside deaminase [Larsenimonas suaedae]MCM2973334.1 nucleoside deaminase [Larsenimonas suaedae]MDR5896227.1 nucleoside deaminase [Larsenimonas suaedae]